MAFGFGLNSYNLQIQWAVAWFPVRADVWLDRPRMWAGSIHHSSGESDLQGDGIGGGGVRAGHSLIGAQSDADSLAPSLEAFITVSLSHDGMFELGFELQMAKRAMQRQRLIIEPDMRVPFMLTAHSDALNEITAHTGAVFHGVAATSARMNDFKDLKSVLKIG